MTFKSHLASLINQINNGLKLKKFCVYSKYFPYSQNFLLCLKNSGYIAGYKIESRNIYVYLKYFDNNLSVLPGITYVSRPSGKRYFKKNNIIPNGIYSTNLGIQMGYNLNVGGELLAYICPRA